MQVKVTLLYGSAVDRNAVLRAIKSAIRTGDKSQIQLQTKQGDEATIECQSFSQGGDWFHLVFSEETLQYHYDAFDGWSIKNINEDDGGDLAPSAKEPFVEFSTNDSGNLNAVTLYGFTAIPPNMFVSQSWINSVDFTYSPNLASIGSRAFESCSNLDNVEITATQIDTRAFTSCSLLRKVWIRNTCETIAASSKNDAPFYGCSTNLWIYVEADSKPAGWGEYFNRTGSSGSSYAHVVYGQTTSPF